MKMKFFNFLVFPFVVISNIADAKNPAIGTDIGRCLGAPLENGVCNRQPVFQRMIMTRVHDRMKARGQDIRCENVTREDLCTITEIDPWYSNEEWIAQRWNQKLDDGVEMNITEGLKTVNREDLEGLYKVRSLRLTFAGITNLPADAFEGLKKPAADDCYPYNPDETKIGSKRYQLRADAIARGFSNPVDKKYDSTHAYPKQKDTAPCVAFLDLGHNNIRGDAATLAPTVLSPLTNLENFEIDTQHGAAFGVLSTQLFNGLTKLQSIDMDENGITAIPMGVFATNVKLETLDLDKNSIKLKTLPTDLLRNMGRMNGSIEASFTGIQGSDARAWKNQYGVRVVTSGLSLK